MRKKLLSIILAIAMLACMIPLGTLTAFAEPVDLSQYDWEGEGNGTEGNPYKIGSKDDLEKLAKIVTDEGNDCSATYFVLTGDIGSTNDPVTTTIGSATNIFNGHFNGDGHTVTVELTDTWVEYYALFSVLGNGGEIINLTTAGCVSGERNDLSGGVCGQNNGTITNCCNTAKVSGGDYLGGVCGKNTGTITNCCNTGTVSGDNDVGGVCGENNGTITNCYNTGTVNGGEESYSAGGVCGENWAGTIANCYNTGTVSGDNDVGGVCGTSWDTITNCYYDNVAYNGDAVGDDEDGTTDYCYGLSATQMKAASKTVLTTGDANNKPLVDLLNEYVTAHSSDNLRPWTNKQGEYPVFGTPHTHRAGTEYMTDGRAHWLKCDDKDCPLIGKDDAETILNYEIAFSSYEGPELKEALDYSEKCGTYSEEKTSMLMGRQGKLDKSTGTVSNTDGRTIIGLTAEQLDKIGNKLVIVGSDDSDNNKQVSVDVDCAYTWFYDIEDGEPVQIKAEDCDCAAFVIIDSELVNDTITGFGYYRVYNDIVSDGTLIGEALYKAPRTFKAVLDSDNILNFYYDTLDHAGEGTLYNNLPTEAKSASSWGYNAIRASVKGANINQNVIKYKGLKSTNNMFYNMTAAESFSGAEYLDVTGVTDMERMFRSYGKSTANAANLEDVPDVSRWNTANVTNMSGLFQSYGQYSAVTKAPDVSHWNTANVTNMFYVFNSYVMASNKIASSLSETPDVSNWNTAKVTDMEGVFANYGTYSTVLNFTLDLSKWDISQAKVTHNLIASAGLNAETWEVIIPAKSGEKSNDAKHWYNINEENEESSIEPDNKRSFTLAQ